MSTLQKNERQEITGQYQLAGFDVSCPFCKNMVANDFSKKGLKYYGIYHAKTCLFIITDGFTKEA